MHTAHLKCTVPFSATEIRNRTSPRKQASERTNERNAKQLNIMYCVMYSCLHLKCACNRCRCYLLFGVLHNDGLQCDPNLQSTAMASCNYNKIKRERKHAIHNDTFHKRKKERKRRMCVWKSISIGYSI